MQAHTLPTKQNKKIIKALDSEHTDSMALRSRRHIPWRLYIWRVPMNGISANWFPWILFDKVVFYIIVTMCKHTWLSTIPLQMVILILTWGCTQQTTLLKKETHEWIKCISYPLSLHQERGQKGIKSRSKRKAGKRRATKRFHKHSC